VPERKISAVIVNHNVRQLLNSAIESASHFLPVPYEVIVVDNASEDGSVSFIREKFPEVILVSNTRNAGFSAANNQGFDLAGGTYILMLNPDAELLDDHIRNAIELLEIEKRSIVAPMLLNPDGSPQQSAWRFPNFASVLLEAVFLNKLIDISGYRPGSVKEYEDVQFASGACLLFRKELLTQLKALDADLFWMDDADFCKRCRENGGRVIYYPAWKVRHAAGSSSVKNQSFVLSNQLISKLKYFRKHGQPVNYLLSAIFMQVHILLRLIILPFPSLFSRSAFSKWIAYVTVQGKFIGFLVTGRHKVG
jgi:GT2 family glycosyltransferase